MAKVREIFVTYKVKADPAIKVIKKVDKTIANVIRSTKRSGDVLKHTFSAIGRSARAGFRNVSTAVKKASYTMKRSFVRTRRYAKVYKNSLNKFLKDNARTVSALKIGLLGLGASIAFVGFKALKTAAQYEQQRIAFVGLLGSVEKADETIERIKKEAARTPFEVAGLTSMTQQLATITKDGNKAVDILMNVGDAIAMSGKDVVEMQRVVLNLQQVASTGKVTELDIRQFQSAIPLFNDILKASNLTTEQLKTSSDAAGLLFGAFEKAAKKGGITFKGLENQSKTLSGRLSTLRDIFSQAALRIGIKLSPAIKNMTEQFITFFESAQFEAMTNDIGELAGKIATDFVPTVKALLPTVTKLGKALVKLGEGINFVLTPLRKFSEFANSVSMAGANVEGAQLTAQEKAVENQVMALSKLRIEREDLASLMQSDKGRIVHPEDAAILANLDRKIAAAKERIKQTKGKVALEKTRIAGNTTKVNDAIIRPNGQVIQPNPKDTLLALKDPVGAVSNVRNQNKQSMVNNVTINVSGGPREAAISFKREFEKMFDEMALQMAAEVA